jgi:hypothetical protein
VSSGLLAASMNAISHTILKSQAPLSAGLGDFASTKSFPIVPIACIGPDSDARIR